MKSARRRRWGGGAEEEAAEDGLVVEVRVEKARRYWAVRIEAFSGREVK